MSIDFCIFTGAVRSGGLEEVKRRFRKEYVNATVEDRLTALHYACGNNNDGSGDIVRYLVSEGWNIEASGTGQWRPIHYAAWWGNISAMTALIEARCILDYRTKNGDTPIDLVMKYGVNNRDECVRLLWSAMEQRETATKDLELLKNDSLLKIMDSTDLEQLKNNSLLKIMDSTDLELLKNNSLLKIMDRTTGKTLLDKCLGYKNTTIIDAIKSMPIEKNDIEEWVSLKLKKVDPDSSRMIHECLLYRCIRHDYHEGFLALCTPDIVNSDSLFMGPTVLETAVEYERSLCVIIMLPKLTRVDESWTRAINMATKKKLTYILSHIEERISELSRGEEKGFSRLHTAVFDNDPRMVEYIVEKKIVDPNHGNKTIGTALSVAYSMDRIKCVQSLQNRNIDVNTVDRWGQTPLHVAISNKTEDHCEYLVQKTKNIETEDCMGFTVIERAVLNNCEHLCEMLMKRGARYDRYLNMESRALDIYHNPRTTLTSRETIQSLCVKVNGTIFPSLFATIDRYTIDITDGNNNTLLHVCAASLLPDLCSQLIRKSANVSIKNNKGNTPLLELLQQNITHDMKQLDNEDTVAVEDDNYRGACAIGADVDVRNELEGNIIDTVNVLIDGGASVNEEDSYGSSVLDKATYYHNDRLLLVLIRKKEPIEVIKKENLSAWLRNRHFQFIKEVIPLINKSFVTRLMTEELITRSMDTADLSLVKVMYDNASNNIQKRVVEDILHKAASVGDKKLFEEMIDNEMSADTSRSGGESLLMSLISDQNTEYCKVILRSRNAALLLGRKNSDSKLPLHVCIETEYWDIIDQIILDTISVNDEDVNGNTPLSLLLEKISKTDDNAVTDRLMSYTKMLIRASADIEHVNKNKRTVISFCTNSHLRKEIESLSHRSRPIQQTFLNAAAPIATSSDSLTIPQDEADTAPILICPICIDEPINCALPCGHTFCSTCVEKTIDCYNCRRRITDVIKLFL